MNWLKRGPMVWTLGLPRASFAPHNSVVAEVRFDGDLPVRGWVQAARTMLAVPWAGMRRIRAKRIRI